MPPWLLYLILTILGLGVLGVGGELLVRGAGRLARSLGVSTLMIGLTVVAFGTSAPEAAVTVFAAIKDAPELAVGNIVGSNIANILLILGVAGLATPIVVSRNLIRIDGPIMILVSGLFVTVAYLHGEIAQWVGGLFLLALVGYTLVTYRLGRTRVPEEVATVPTGLGRHWWFNGVLIVVGIGGLVGGAQLIVQGASGIASLLGVSEHVIGLTIVAIGTSLPELATAVVAARQKQPDIAIGNVVGSNIFNILFVAGLAAATRPLPVPADILRFDGPFMLFVCVMFYPLAWSGQRIVRWEGAVLLLAYIAYLGRTVMQALG